MILVFSQLAGTYCYSSSITYDHYGNTFPIPSTKKPNRTRDLHLQNSNRKRTNFFQSTQKIRTETNPCHERTRTDHEPKFMGSFPCTHLYACMAVTVEPTGGYTHWLKSCEEGGGSPEEARLEQTPYPFHTQLIRRYLGIK